jgi:hypothetical protein
MTAQGRLGPGARRGRASAPSILLLCTLLSPPGAFAGNFSLGESIGGNYRLTLNYSASMRTRDPAEALINGPIDPFQAELAPDGQLVGFTHTGLPTTINFDDGNRNFNKYALTHNRITAYGELGFTYDTFGAVFSGDTFYDDVYRRLNDNDSPDTVNKDLPNDEFTPAAQRFNGHRSRLLDAYVYGDFMLGDEATLNLRIGQQVVAWGESLFLYGLALSQGRADATRAYVPGAETKEILLPTTQVAFRLSPGWARMTLLGYYKLDFKATEIFPIGDFLAVQDLVGPGGDRAYGSLNPAYADGCPGLLDIPMFPLDTSALVCNQQGLGGDLFDADPYIMVPRGPDITPRRHGQWGAGLTFPVGGALNMGLYHIRYHSSNPFVQLNPGFAPVTRRPPLTTEVINQYVPTSYQVGYADGIHLSAISFSTVLGVFNVAGELIYRDNVDLQVQAVISGVLSPVYTRGEIYQALMSALYVTNPNIWYDEFVFVGEAAYVRTGDIEPFEPQPGIQPVGNGDVPFNDHESIGYQTLFLLTKRNMLDGWDFKTQFSWGEIVRGNPPLTAAFGALYGEGDQRGSVAIGVQYLQNFEVMASFNKFLGDPHATIGDSTLASNPYSDRDYVALNIKYNL